MQTTMTIQIWLHKALDEDGEAGYHAWSLSQLGFATWAETESQLLEKTHSKLVDYWQFRQRHSLLSQTIPSTKHVQVEVVERVTGNEILFSPDYQVATSTLVDETIALIEATRCDLLELIHGTPDQVLDWDPPYRRFPSWARWRTIRQILAHIANAETHYYLPNIGIQPNISPATEKESWQEYLTSHRGATLQALHALKASRDLARVQFHDDGAWSVRKVLRRLVWHERLHTKSIQRIIKDYWDQHDRVTA